MSEREELRARIAAQSREIARLQAEQREDTQQAINLRLSSLYEAEGDGEAASRKRPSTIVYEEMWIERQNDGDRLMVATELKGADGAPFWADVQGIGVLQFEYVAVVKSRAIFQASLQCSAPPQGQPWPHLARLVWSRLLVGS